MKKVLILTGCMALIGSFLFQGLASAETDGLARYWNQWRGPDMTGIFPGANPPIEWSEKGKNIKWKTKIPGKGHASPVIWQNKVFLVSATKIGQKVKSAELKATEKELPAWRRLMGKKVTHTLRFIVFAIDRTTGGILWQRTAVETVPHEGIFKDGSWASASPVTDGEYLLAYFGSSGLYCYDLQGNLQWEKDFGQMDILFDFGEGSSPLLYDDTVIVNWDHEGQSFIIALDKRTGTEKWRTGKDETTTWSTPIVASVDGKLQVITSGNKRTRGYDLQTGKQIWEAGGLYLNTIPTPIFDNGTVFVASGYQKQVIQAIRVIGARGDITGTDAIRWHQQEDAPYTPSLLLYGDTLYGLKVNKGILSCYDPMTGERYYGPQRLPGIKGVFASPVGAGGRVYLIGRNGTSLVIKQGKTFEVLAQNSLDDNFDASPAIAASELYLRGHKYLYCIRQ